MNQPTCCGSCDQGRKPCSCPEACCRPDTPPVLPEDAQHWCLSVAVALAVLACVAAVIFP